MEGGRENLDQYLGCNSMLKESLSWVHGMVSFIFTWLNNNVSSMRPGRDSFVTKKTIVDRNMFAVQKKLSSLSSIIMRQCHRVG